MVSDRFNVGYQPKKDIENLDPPKGGSGVKDVKGEQRNLFAKARILDSLTRLYISNADLGAFKSDDLHRHVKDKIEKILDEI